LSCIVRLSPRILSPCSAQLVVPCLVSSPPLSYCLVQVPTPLAPIRSEFSARFIRFLSLSSPCLAPLSQLAQCGSALSLHRLAPFSQLASFGSAISAHGVRLGSLLAAFGSIISANSSPSAPHSSCLVHLHSISSPCSPLLSQLTSFTSTLSAHLLWLDSQLASF